MPSSESRSADTSSQLYTVEMRFDIWHNLPCLCSAIITVPRRLSSAESTIRRGRPARVYNVLIAILTSSTT